MRFFSSRKSVPVDAEAPRPRRRLMAVVAGTLATLLVGAGLTVAAVAPAQAHTPNYSSSCTGLTIDLQNYVSSDRNTVSYTWEGTNGDTGQKTDTFGSNYKVVVPFDDAYSYKWTLKVETSGAVTDAQKSAWNVDDTPDHHNATKGLNPTKPCTTPPVTPKFTPSVTPCTSTSQAVIPLTVSIDNPTPNHSYTVSVSGFPNKTIGADHKPVSFDTPRGGGTYRVQVTDDQNGKTSDVVPVNVAACPPPGTFVKAVATPCATPTGTPTITVTSDGIVAKKQYTATVKSGTAEIVKATPYTANDNGELTILVPASTSLSDVTVVVKIADDQTLTSNPVTVSPCPSGVSSVSISAQACPVDGQPTATILASDLVKGRAYEVLVDGKVIGSYTATKDADSAPFSVTVTPGVVHKVALRDVLSGYVTDPQDLTSGPCAKTPTILDVTAQPCLVANGAGGLSVTVDGLVDGRTYLATVVDAKGATVGSKPIDGKDGAKQTVDFGQLPADASYAVTVTDDKEPTATATKKDVKVAPCPDVAGVSLQCVPGSNATLVVTSTVPAGKTFDVTLVRTDVTPEKLQASRTVSSAEAASLSFPGTPNGQYRITLTATDNTIQPIVDNTVVACATTTPPTTPPNTPPTTPNGVGGVQLLATTGADVVAPAIGAVALLQLGALLVALTVIRRRKESRA